MHTAKNAILARRIMMPTITASVSQAIERFSMVGYLGFLLMLSITFVTQIRILAKMVHQDQGTFPLPVEECWFRSH